MGAFSVKQGSLFPALHRIERQGWLHSFWGRSESNRHAKYYQLTKAGRRQLETEILEWENISLRDLVCAESGIAHVLLRADTECRRRVRCVGLVGQLNPHLHPDVLDVCAQSRCATISFDKTERRFLV